MSEAENKTACKDREEQIALYLWDELDAAAASLLEEHLETCPGCAAYLQREGKLNDAVAAAAPADPPVDLLAQCRVDLSEELDRAGLPGFWTRLGTVLWPRGLRWSPRGWMAAHPAWSAAVFVLVGISLGGMLPRLVTSPLMDARGQSSAEVREPVSALPVSTGNLRGIDISQDGSLEFQTSGDPGAVVRRQLDDPGVQGLLVDVLEGGMRFTGDTRITSVDLLGELAHDQQVRQSLCRVARTDRNPAVRLKAIEALRDLGQVPEVRQTLLDALLRDDNPGVRIEAINALRELAEASTAAPDEELMRVFRERMEKDPDTYIRVQSAAAVRKLAERGVY